MAKQKSKGKKLDVLIEEVAKLKSRVKALLKQQAAIASAVEALKKGDKPHKAKRSSKPRKPAAAKASAEKRRGGPVLVQASPSAAAKGGAS